MKSYSFHFVTILSVVMAFLLTEIILYSRNTLMVHPEWASGKCLLSEPMMGCEEGFTSRNILNQNRLNLQEWHGFNEILLNRLFHAGYIGFNFYLKENSYLNILFNKNKNSFSGIRISTHPGFPSIFFRATREGKFLVKESIINLTVANTWHRAALIFQSNTLIFIVDSQVIQRFQEPSLEKQIIGFRSGINDTMVDDVEVNDINGKLVIHENFRNNKSYWYLLFLNFSLIVGIMGIVFLSGYIMKLDRKRTVFQTLLFQLCAIVILVLYYSYDYYYWSRLYHYKASGEWGRIKIGRQIGYIERLRVIFFTKYPFFYSNYSGNSSYSSQSLNHFLEINPTEYSGLNLNIIRNDSENRQFEVAEDNYKAIQTYLKEKPFLPGFRILLLGTSQMWGSGATLISDRIGSQIHEILSTRFGRKNNFYVINASQRGSNSKELLQRHKGHLFLLEPDLVIVNLSNNDKVDIFRDNLYSLIEFNKNKNIKTLFVLEANSTEKDYSILKIKHGIMSTLAKENNIPLIDLHGYLSNTNVYDSGILWWDSVHNTSYGQKLAAEFIVQGIINHFDMVKK